MPTLATVAMHLEVWGPRGRGVVALAGDRVTVGKARANDMALADDEQVSRLHAVLERYPTGWTVRDVGSANGTFVNGERLINERVLRPGDEIRFGATIVVYRDDALPDIPTTEPGEAPPELTPRERDVLVELCRPLFAGAMFTRPAPARQIARALGVTEGAVKQHLARLYDKFGIHPGGEPRPLRLANDAISRGAVALADLRTRASDDA